MPKVNYRQIHETSVRDILNVIDDGKEILTGNNKRKVGTFKSIARQTAGMVLVFPVACSKSLSSEIASILTKAIERKCVTMMQMLFSAYQLSSSKDAIEFVSQFHKNMKVSHRYSIDDFIGDMDAIAAKCEGVVVNRVALKAIQEDMKNINFYLERDIDNRSYGSYSVSRTGVLREDKWTTDNLPYDLSPSDLKDMEQANQYAANARAAEARAKLDEERLKEVQDRRNRSKDEYGDKEDSNNSTKKADGKGTSYGYKDINAFQSYARQTLLDSDIKKANEMQPSLMIVNFMAETGNGNTATVDGAVIGIKAKLIGLESSDIIDHIITKNSDKHFLLQLLRATTRETSFFKDFLFAIDNAKIDAINNSKAGSSNPMWKVLEQRAIKSRIRRITNSGNDASAIATLVISQSEVEYMRKENNVDLMNIRVIAPIMEAYNFMGIIIVNEPMEVVHVTWDDGENSWEDISFNSLQKESKDADYKKIINLMTKIR